MSEAGLLRFVASLAAEGLSATTIKCYLSSVHVQHFQLSSGLGDPKVGDMATLQHDLKGIKSTQAKIGHKPRPSSIMLWAACTTCLFCFLRSGEITASTTCTFHSTYHLTLEDISIDNIGQPGAVRVRIKASKTDPFRKGVDIFLGRTSNSLCPVAALLAYLVIRGKSPGPLFCMANGAYLTRDFFVREVRKALVAVGVDQSKYSGHSFRIGAATTATAAGIADLTIKTLGRWESSAYQLYIRLSPEELTSICTTLAKVDK